MQYLKMYFLFPSAVFRCLSNDIALKGLFNACTLVRTVFRWHKKMEFKFHFYFSFFFGLLKWNSISISIFRFLSTCDTDKRIWISFFVFRFRRTLKRGFEFPVFVFRFLITLKTDSNFVFRLSFSHHFGKRISMSFFVLALLVIEKQIGVFCMNLKSGLTVSYTHLTLPTKRIV